MLFKCNVDSIQDGDNMAKVVSCVRDLGLWFDENLNFNTHITKCSNKAHRQLYWIKQIRSSLTEEAANTLIHAFVTSTVDYIATHRNEQGQSNETASSSKLCCSCNI